jgi:hypothetical protein
MNVSPRDPESSENRSASLLPGRGMRGGHPEDQQNEGSRGAGRQGIHPVADPRYQHQQHNCRGPGRQ